MPGHLLSGDGPTESTGFDTQPAREAMSKACHSTVEVRPFRTERSVDAPFEP